MVGLFYIASVEISLRKKPGSCPIVENDKPGEQIEQQSTLRCLVFDNYVPRPALINLSDHEDFMKQAKTAVDARC